MMDLETRRLAPVGDRVAPLRWDAGRWVALVRDIQPLLGELRPVLAAIAASPFVAACSAAVRSMQEDR